MASLMPVKPSAHITITSQTPHASADVDNSEVEAIRKENTELKDKVNPLEARMKHLESLILKMSKEN